MLTSEELAALRSAIPGDPDLTRLLGTLRLRGGAVLATRPSIPGVKALLSRDGGICPTDGSNLLFDPWNPERHRCPRCGEGFTGRRHHLHWARAQHLWIVERAADLALVAALTGDAPAAAGAAELLGAYDELYFALPNSDNVLGPSHLFFSTYLESLWVTSYLAAAFLLREAGLLPLERVNGIDRVADEAATLIGEFNEGLSNRQTWHAAALTAISAWFDDVELANTAVEARTGLLGHLAEGFGSDGLWWEGENYHLFALRGAMQGLHWARAVGYDLLEDAEIRGHFRAALLAPTRSALPDFTYPARRDSRYGVSLALPPSLELWEIGRAWVGEDPELNAWLGALYVLPPSAVPVQQYDAWLHDAGRTALERPGRGDLSWWALTAMAPAPVKALPWRADSALLADQGLAVLRREDRYVSLECGPDIGGHGHPDRLHLTLHAGAVHWLPDPGTGSYVEPELAWYRSALAHNAPLLDGVNAGGADAWCAAFDSGEEWAWCRGRAAEVTRTVVAGPTQLLDVLEVEAGEAREVILPWHLQGDWRVESPGTWEPATLEHPFVSTAERFVAQGGEPPVVSATSPGTAAGLRLCFVAPGAELLRAVAPGLPMTNAPSPFLLLRAKGNLIRWVTVLDTSPAGSPSAMTGARVTGQLVELTTSGEPIRFHFSDAGVKVEAGSPTLLLAGLRPAPPRHRSLRVSDPTSEALALAPRVAEAPALDGTLSGFDLSAPLSFDSELQYRRSEEPWNPERFSAQCWVNWDGKTLYLAVSVTKPERLFRPPGAPPLELDNEPDDIHSDGLQLYLSHGGQGIAVLLVPRDGGSLGTRTIGRDGGEAPPVGGRWAPTHEGYLITVRVADPGLALLGPGDRLGFDLLINEMRPGRLRRAGQLVWSGGNGWVYLRGDRQDPSDFGTLELG